MALKCAAVILAHVLGLLGNLFEIDLIDLYRAKSPGRL